MNRAKFTNGIALLVGLVLTVCYQFERQSTNKREPIIAQRDFNQVYERWQLKPGSIYEGDSLMVRRGEEELKVSLCGIDSPELEQPLGKEARNYLQSLIDKSESDGTIFVTPVEENKRETVAELYVHIGNRRVLFLNSQMLAAGYAWHEQKDSSNCPNLKALIAAENIAKQKKLGVQSAGHQKLWGWLKQSLN